MAEHAVDVRADEFYVGYLNPVPRGYARRVRAAVLALSVLVVGAAGVIAGRQSDAGDAAWEVEPAALTGLFVALPYPVLFVEGELADAAPRAVILVGAGKCGAFEPAGYCGLLGGSGGPADREQSRAAAMRLFDGKLVQVRGTRLRRDGRVMFELEAGERAVVVAADDPERVKRLRVDAAEGTQAMFLGRIVDAKCYLGAMRPGDGKTHRACAVRCIVGGIPAMLVESGGGRSRYLLLEDSRGDPVNAAILPFVGDEVELSGRERGRSADIAWLKVDLSSVRRR